MAAGRRRQSRRRRRSARTCAPTRATCDRADPFDATHEVVPGNRISVASGRTIRSQRRPTQNFKGPQTRGHLRSDAPIPGGAEDPPPADLPATYVDAVCVDSARHDRRADWIAPWTSADLPSDDRGLVGVVLTDTSAAPFAGLNHSFEPRED